MNSSANPPRSRLASRKSDKITNLELESKPLLPQLIASTRSCLPCWKPMLGEIDSNLRSIKDFFSPLGGNNFDVRDMDGLTPLHAAADMGHDVVVEYLVHLGADVYAKDDQGLSPLDVANKLGKHNLVAIMLGKKTLDEEQVEEDDKSSWVCNKDGFKWATAALNVGVEILQAILSQQQRHYRRLGVLLPLVCLVISVCEMVYEAKRERVEWRKRRGCYWLYYPGRNGKAFGRFMLWFGLVSSTLQVCTNLVSLERKKEVMRFDYTGLLLAICYLMSRFGCGKRTMTGVDKCSEHSECQVEGKIEQERWVFECLDCRMGKLV